MSTELEASLERARRRVAEATRGSPEWDAAMSGVEDLEATARAAIEGEREAAEPSVA